MIYKVSFRAIGVTQSQVLLLQIMKLSLMFPLLYAAAAGVGVAAKHDDHCLYNSDFSEGTFIIDEPGSSYK